MSKSIAIITILISGFASSKAQGQEGRLSVMIKNLQNADGKIIVALFDHEKDWLEKGVKKESIISKAYEASVIFENVKVGTYAVSVIHDENDNDTLDTGAFGIPSEPYGFSNDAKGMFGPASFDDAKFIVSRDQQIEISVK